MWQKMVGGFSKNNAYHALIHQEEEVCTAEEQPASNKMDAYTIVRELIFQLLLLFYYR